MIRAPLAALLLLAAACGPSPSLEDLRAAGYEHLNKGEIREALAISQEGMRRASDGHDPRWKRTFSVLAAEILVAQRRSQEALDVLAETMAEERSDTTAVRGLMTQGYARCLIARSAADAAVADRHLAGAGRLAATLHSDPLAGEVALRRGTCQMLQDDDSRAETHFRQVLVIARRQRLTSLECQVAGNIGLLRARAGAFDDATDWLRASIELATAAKAEMHLLTARLNLGWCYYRLGAYDKAAILLGQAATIAEERELTDHQLKAWTLLGNTAYRNGDWPTAADYYRRSATLARTLGARTDEAILLGNASEVLVQLEQYPDAEATIAEALRVNEETGDVSGRQLLLLTVGEIHAHRDEVEKAEETWRSVASSSDAESETVWQALVGLAGLHQRSGATAEADRYYRRALELMEDARGLLRADESRISFFSTFTRFYDDYVAFLVSSARPFEALAVADGSYGRILREKLGGRTGHDASRVVSSGDPRRVAAQLDGVALLYWLAPERSFVWAVTKRGATLRTLASEDLIERDIETHQSLLLRSRDPLREGHAEAGRLWRTLIQPVVDLIPPGSRVVVVPDGPLHQLNLETLIVPTPVPHYWIEDVTVARAPSLSLLDAHLPRPGSGAHRVFLMGDPISPTEEFPPLPYAGSELDGIAALFDTEQRAMYVGLRATPSSYTTSQPNEYAFLHFAAHATANPESPLDSAIVLSSENDSYKLYARDIVDVPLRADLVTLSACRSAGSRAYAGEGLVGLAWAFLSAGARNVIGGLWNVEDASTAELMEELYRGLNAGLDPASALRAAKLKLLHSGTAYRKPYYWAPFVIYTRDGAPASASASGPRSASKN